MGGTGTSSSSSANTRRKSGGKGWGFGFLIGKKSGKSGKSAESGQSGMGGGSSEGAGGEGASASVSASVMMLSEAARECGVVLVGGSIPERCPSSGNLYNTCCVFSGDGVMAGLYKLNPAVDP